MDALNAAFMQEGHAHQTGLDQDDILVLAIVLADDAAPLVMPWRQGLNDGFPAIDVCGEIGGIVCSIAFVLFHNAQLLLPPSYGKAAFSQ